MTVNSLSEGFVRITYSGATIPHHAIIPINFAGTPTPGVEPTLSTRSGGTKTVTAGVSEYVTELAKSFGDETIFGLAECYLVDFDDEERHFIYAWTVALNGSSVNGNVPLAMYTMTFKTIQGGILRVVAMESTLTVNQVVDPPFSSFTFLADLSTYVVSDDSIVIGRDNAYAFAPIRVKSKTSDALRKAGGL